MAAPTPFGTEFLVNTSTLNDQDTPSVAALANGKFVVVFEYDRSAVGQGNDGQGSLLLRNWRTHPGQAKYSRALSDAIL